MDYKLIAKVFSNRLAKVLGSLIAEDQTCTVPGHTILGTCHVLRDLIQWVIFRSILLSGDVEENPGPDSGTFKFCTWNLNSIVAHDFFCVSLLEAYNSVYNYDLMAITETHLDSKVDKNKLGIDGYTFLKNNHPLDIKRGGVGLYVKDSFPAIRRPELEILLEWIICEIQLDRKKHFYVVAHRSPSQIRVEFENFMNTFEQMLSMLAAENPYSTIITGDLNCRSSQWWENDVDNYEGKLLSLSHLTLV